MPDVVESTDAPANGSTPYNIAVGQFIHGSVGAGGDNDWYRISLVAGETYTIAVTGNGNRGINLSDSVLSVYDNTGAQVTFNDDWLGFFSSVTFTATTSGFYFVSAAGYTAPGFADTGYYAMTVTAGSRASLDIDMGAAVLARPEQSWSAPGTPATISWAVRQSFAGSTDADDVAAPFSQLSGVQTAAVQSMLAHYSEVAGLTFNQVAPGGTSNDATMLFSNYTSTTDGAGAYALYPGSPPQTGSANRQGDVHFNTQSVSTTNMDAGTYSYFAALHEIGHALGLAHPGDYNAAAGVSITYGTHAQFIQDSQQYTIMSYFDEGETGANFGGYAQTLMMADIYALQNLYGVNYSTRAGNTVYGFNSSLAGTVYDFSANGTPAICIWDGGGTDTIDVSGYGIGQQINLNQGTFSNVGGLTSNLSIAYRAVIENAIGGSGADTIIGNGYHNRLEGGVGGDILGGGDGNDTLIGGTGNDSLVGGTGDDIYSVEDGGDAVTEYLNQGTDQVYASINYTLTANVEVLMIVDSATTGYGNAINNWIYGSNLDNVISGGAGNDYMEGGAGNDIYYVDIGYDYVQETAGAGVDQVRSTTSYAIMANVEVLFLEGSAALGIGNDLNNWLYGNGFNNTLQGGAGGDALWGYEGDDVLDGGAGVDGMRGGIGNDSYYCDSTSDQIVELAGEGTDTVYASVSYWLSNFVERLTLIGTGHVNASGNADANYVIGNSSNNGIDGGAGTDWMQGGGGADTFVLRRGQTHGDVIADFDGLGGGAGDQLMLAGFGAGAFLTRLSATDWLIQSSLGHEYFSMSNSANLDASDFYFV